MKPPMPSAAVVDRIAARANLGVVRRFGREARAFARLAALLPRDVGTVLPDGVVSGEDVVILLHGLFATAGVLRPLGDALRSATGAHVATFTYEPGPGVEELAVRLGKLVERLPEDARLHLVGHSLGGVIARWFVQLQGGDPRVSHTVSLGSPFAGAQRARWMPGSAGKDILPGSPTLRRLTESSENSHVPHFSISASEDALVGAHSALPGWGHVVIPSCGHNGLLFDARALRRVADRVLEFQSRT